MLDHGKSRLQDEVERMEPAAEVQWSRDRESGLAADVAWASRRVIDLVLEVAVKSENLEGVKLALEHGANPNARMLRVEGSFRERHTGLSLAMRLCKPEFVELLLNHPGIEAGPAQAVALWWALRKTHDKWVEVLCAKGVAFEHDEVPTWVQAMNAEEKAESCGPFSVFFQPQELELARRLAAELPCVPPDHVSWFYEGNGQGGMWHTVLESLLEADDVGRLERLAELGLSLKLTTADYAAVAHGGSARCLAWLMERWGMPEDKRALILAQLHGVPVPVKIELSCHQWRNDSIPFHVELLRDTLHTLVADARQCHRLYELMMIRRPGDVLKYLWVRVINVPRSVASRCRDAADRQWPAGCLPLLKFDSFFYWAWDDTEPESSTWLTYREGAEFNETLNTLYAEVRQAQDELRHSDDVLIQAELRGIDQQTHHLDRQPNPPVEITCPGAASHSLVSPRRTSAYYDRLREIVARPDVRIVSMHTGDDYQTLRILCAEQRRRAIATGKALMDALTIHVLTDGLPFTRGWRPQIVTWQEGLGYGDLFIDGGPCRSSDDDKPTYTEEGICYNLRLFKMRLFLTHRSVPAGDAGWARYEGVGWTFFEDLRTDQGYAEGIAHSIERHSHWPRGKD
ncbi:ankyrin repeat domain-containing protein [Prosthecobacter sp.]|uniref:ankyrin repeat domain-containing protein n=1 Tax=Prosthecobacter sp. TaxID=1965333 RepID=UPI00378378E7